MSGYGRVIIPIPTFLMLCRYLVSRFRCRTRVLVMILMARLKLMLFRRLVVNVIVIVLTVVLLGLICNCGKIVTNGLVFRRPIFVIFRLTVFRRCVRNGFGYKVRATSVSRPLTGRTFPLLRLAVSNWRRPLVTGYSLTKFRTNRVLSCQVVVRLPVNCWIRRSYCCRLVVCCNGRVARCWES